MTESTHPLPCGKEPTFEPVYDDSKDDELERWRERQRKNGAMVMQRKALLAPPSPKSTSLWLSLDNGSVVVVDHMSLARGRSDGCGKRRT